jgi:putative redox protein
MDVTVRWKTPMLMVGVADETTAVLMDTKPESGGSGVGPSPVETVLMALAGCSGMDVVGILRKTRAPLEGLTISATAERAAEHPRVFTAIHLRYAAWGRGLTAEQVSKAVALSEDKYCSVSAMLRKTASITHEIAVSDTADENDTPQQTARGR